MNNAKLQVYFLSEPAQLPPTYILPTFPCDVGKRICMLRLGIQKKARREEKGGGVIIGWTMRFSLKSFRIDENNICFLKLLFNIRKCSIGELFGGVVSF